MRKAVNWWLAVTMKGLSHWRTPPGHSELLIYELRSDTGCVGHQKPRLSVKRSLAFINPRGKLCNYARLCMFWVTDLVRLQLVRGHPGVRTCFCVRKFRLTDDWQQSWKGHYKSAWDAHARQCRIMDQEGNGTRTVGGLMRMAEFCDGILIILWTPCSICHLMGVKKIKRNV